MWNWLRLDRVYDNLGLDWCTEGGKGLEVILKLAISLDKEAILIGLLSHLLEACPWHFKIKTRKCPGIGQYRNRKLLNLDLDIYCQINLNMFASASVFSIFTLWNFIVVTDYIFSLF